MSRVTLPTATGAHQCQPARASANQCEPCQGEQALKRELNQRQPTPPTSGRQALRREPGDLATATSANQCHPTRANAKEPPRASVNHCESCKGEQTLKRESAPLCSTKAFENDPDVRKKKESGRKSKCLLRYQGWTGVGLSLNAAQRARPRTWRARCAFDSMP